MRIVQGIVIGSLTMLVGFLMYPPYINYIYTPCYDLMKSMFPTLPPEQEIFWKLFPFVILFAIIGGGIMWIIGKKNLSSGGGGAGTESK
jgi:hypothetical protein